MFSMSRVVDDVNKGDHRKHRLDSAVMKEIGVVIAGLGKHLHLIVVHGVLECCVLRTTYIGLLKNL